MIKYTNNYKFIISVIIVFLLNVLIAKSFQLTSILRDIVVIFILSIAVFAINILIKHFGRNISIFHILIWTIIFSIGYAIAGFILILIYKHEIIIGAMPLYVKLGLLIGLGISIGLEVKELLLKRSPK
jgi:hypothetical protein